MKKEMVTVVILLEMELDTDQPKRNHDDAVYEYITDLVEDSSLAYDIEGMK